MNIQHASAVGRLLFDKSVRSMTMTKIGHLSSFSPAFTVLGDFDGFPGKSGRGGAWWDVKTCLETLRSSRKSGD
jgi:hypothetical protein